MEKRKVQRTHIRPREIAAAVGVNIHSIYRLIYSGEMQAIRVGRSILVPVSEFQRVFKVEFPNP